MKLTRYISPISSTMIKEAIAAAGVHGLTVSEANGYGRQRGHTRGLPVALNTLWT